MCLLFYLILPLWSHVLFFRFLPSCFLSVIPIFQFFSAVFLNHTHTHTHTHTPPRSPGPSLSFTTEAFISKPSPGLLSTLSIDASPFHNQTACLLPLTLSWLPQRSVTVSGDGRFPCKEPLLLPQERNKALKKPSAKSVNSNISFKRTV